jgi:dipeptidyl aminopeptidase/acylaminoacyl peptidase
MLRSLPLSSFFIAFVLTPLYGQQARMDAVLQQLQNVRHFGGVSISPDGRWVAWIEELPGESRHSEIYLQDLSAQNAKPRRIAPADPKQASSQSGIAWSPDSSRFAYIANPGGDQRQIFLFSPASGKTAQLTHANGYVTSVSWSRDGKQIAFLYAESGGGAGPLEAEPAQTGVIGAAIHNQRISVMDANGGAVQQLTPSDLNVYEYDWSPDGQHFAAIAAPGPADNNWWVAKLYTADARSGAMNVVYSPPIEQQIAVPRWSPDGKNIAFVAGLMSDEGFTGGNIFVLPAEGGAPRDLTENSKFSASGLTWRGPDSLLISEYVDGGGSLATLHLNGQTEVLWKGGEAMHWDGNYPNMSLAANGKTSAVVRSTWQQPPEVFAGPLGDWQQLTHENASQQPQWGKAESITWQEGDFTVQGWLLPPKNIDPNKKYPMVVSIHGGPAGVRSPSWPTASYDMSVMASLGYYVFFPNPRGSYGDGEAFTKANVKDFGGGDLKDILAGVDAVLSKAPVDSSRIGVTGWSYGGFMTMWTVTQTHRFRAAVAGAGIADWLSYYGENMIDKWMVPYFGASVYEDPAVYAKSSPITYINNVKTPTLVVVGERDGECPAPQSFEFWHALKSLNVPTELVVYEGEGHSFHKPSDRVDVLRRTLAWFQQYLQGEPANGQ